MNQYRPLRLQCHCELNSVGNSLMDHAAGVNYNSTRFRNWAMGAAFIRIQWKCCGDSGTHQRAVRIIVSPWIDVLFIFARRKMEYSTMHVSKSQWCAVPKGISQGRDRFRIGSGVDFVLVGAECKNQAFIALNGQLAHARGQHRARGGPEHS